MMSRDTWNSLSLEEQTAWDQLSPKAKAGILEYGKQQVRENSANRLPRLRQRKGNFHEAEEVFEDAKQEEAEQDTDDEDDNTLLAHATKQAPAHGDLLKVLSSRGKPTQPPKQNQKAQSNMTELTINGKTYRQVNAQDIIYHV